MMTVSVIEDDRPAFLALVSTKGRGSCYLQLRRQPASPQRETSDLRESRDTRAGYPSLVLASPDQSVVDSTRGRAPATLTREKL